MFGGMPASLRPSSPCCWWVEIAGMVATLLIRPRSVARQMRCRPSKTFRVVSDPALDAEATSGGRSG